MNRDVGLHGTSAIMVVVEIATRLLVVRSHYLESMLKGPL